MQHNKQFSNLLWATVLTFALPNIAIAVPLYTAEYLGTGSSYEVNNLGQVVGNSGGRGFLYSNGTTTILSPALGAAHGINDSGQIVGVVGINSYLYNNGVVTYINGKGSANAINENGQIIFRNSNQLYSNGVSSQMAGMNGSWGSNDLGQVVGQSAGRAALYSNGTTAQLIAASSIAYEINNSGQIVGSYRTTANVDHAFVLSNGIMTDIGALLGQASSGAYANNERGQVVGGYSLGSFLYSDGSMFNLNDLVDPLFSWGIKGAMDINDSGQIAATGCTKSGCGALLLTPISHIPEPASIALIGLGLLGIFANRSRSFVSC